MQKIAEQIPKPNSTMNNVVDTNCPRQFFSDLLTRKAVEQYEAGNVGVRMRYTTR